MIHFTFIISLNQRLSPAHIKIICWLDKDKGKNGVFYIPRMSLSADSGPQFFACLFTLKVI